MCSGVSADGSPVDVYAALPSEPELGMVKTLIGDRSRVLDLGCGTGRIADPLALQGHDVVAVDESPAMLSHVEQASPHCASIEQVDLGITFDVVLLLSHLINGANALALLRTAARHLCEGGLLVAQRLPPDQRWRPGSSKVGPVTVELTEVSVDGSCVDGATRYALAGRSWVQHWRLWELSDEAVRALLVKAGLHSRTINGAWLAANLAED